MKSSIIIVTGKIRSGKTTELFRWISNRLNIGGILQPIIENRRFFYSIRDKSIIQLEISQQESEKLSEKEIIKLGNYVFLRSAFEKVKNILHRDFEQKVDYLIIDEIGPLELEGLGFEPLITEIVSMRENYPCRLIFVVRENLLDAVVTKYQIQNECEIIESKKLLEVYPY